MARGVFAMIAGVVLAVILTMIVERIGHAVYPPPTDIDFSDVAAMNEYVRNLPFGALVFVWAAWITGAFGGGLLACFIAKSRPFVFAAGVGGLILFATAYTLVTIPHPFWFSLCSVVGIVVSSLAAGVIGSRFLTVRPGVPS